MWTSIKNRCFNKNQKAYPNYGGRGISIQWRFDFLAFRDYVTSLPNYKKTDIGMGGLTLDRINNDKNYEVDNLQWVSHNMQARNRRVKKTNKSGYSGVCFMKAKGRYNSTIMVNGQTHYFGLFSNAKDAFEARKAFIIENQLEGFEIDLLPNKIKN